MKALAQTTLLCLTTGLLIAAGASSRTAAAQRGPAAGRQQPIEHEAQRASATTGRNLDTSTLEDYFALGDYDSSGSISFREARSALTITRAGFARYDTNRDGLIDMDEFVERYSEALLVGDTLPEPLPERDKSSRPVRSAAQLRLAFDADANGLLSAEEVQAAFTLYEKPDLDTESVIERLDLDNSGSLDLGELEGLVPMLFIGDALGLLGDSTESERETESEIRTVLDLFGERIVRESDTNASALPPQIVGPVGHFNRLDSNADGVLTFDDLEAIMRPIQSSIRLRAVIATLDANEDGVVTRDEFWNSM